MSDQRCSVHCPGDGWEAVAAAVGVGCAVAGLVLAVVAAVGVVLVAVMAALCVTGVAVFAVLVQRGATWRPPSRRVVRALEAERARRPVTVAGPERPAIAPRLPVHAVITDVEDWRGSTATTQSRQEER